MINKVLGGIKDRLSMKTIISLITIMFILSFTMILISQSVQAADPPKVYFRFDIPLGCHYSPGWFGVMDKVCKDVTVVYENDKAGYGFAYTTDTFIPPEVTVVSKVTVDDIVLNAKDEKDIYAGAKLTDRWLPEVRVESVECIVKDGVIILKSDLSKDAEYYGETVYKKAVYCSVCEEFITWDFSGLLTSRFILTCPKGHRMVTASFDAIEAIGEIEIEK